jgi:hypothetical protein
VSAGVTCPPRPYTPPRRSSGAWSTALRRAGPGPPPPGTHTRIHTRQGRAPRAALPAVRPGRALPQPAVTACSCCCAGSSRARPAALCWGATHPACCCAAGWWCGTRTWSSARLVRPGAGEAGEGRRSAPPAAPAAAAAGGGLCSQWRQLGRWHLARSWPLPLWPRPAAPHTRKLPPTGPQQPLGFSGASYVRARGSTPPPRVALAPATRSRPT